MLNKKEDNIKTSINIEFDLQAKKLFETNKKVLDKIDQCEKAYNSIIPSISTLLDYANDDKANTSGVIQKMSDVYSTMGKQLNVKEISDMGELLKTGSKTWEIGSSMLDKLKESNSPKEFFNVINNTMSDLGIDKIKTKELVILNGIVTETSNLYSDFKDNNKKLDEKFSSFSQALNNTGELMNVPGLITAGHIVGGVSTAMNIFREGKAFIENINGNNIEDTITNGLHGLVKNSVGDTLDNTKQFFQNMAEFAANKIDTVKEWSPQEKYWHYTHLAHMGKLTNNKVLETLGSVGALKETVKQFKFDTNLGFTQKNFELLSSACGILGSLTGCKALEKVGGAITAGIGAYSTAIGIGLTFPPLAIGIAVVAFVSSIFSWLWGGNEESQQDQMSKCFEHISKQIGEMHKDIQNMYKDMIKGFKGVHDHLDKMFKCLMQNFEYVYRAFEQQAKQIDGFRCESRYYLDKILKNQAVLLQYANAQLDTTTKLNFEKIQTSILSDIKNNKYNGDNTSQFMLEGKKLIVSPYVNGAFQYQASRENKNINQLNELLAKVNNPEDLYSLLGMIANALIDINVLTDKEVDSKLIVNPDLLLQMVSLYTQICEKFDLTLEEQYRDYVHTTINTNTAFVEKINNLDLFNKLKDFYNSKVEALNNELTQFYTSEHTDKIKYSIFEERESIILNYYKKNYSIEVPVEIEHKHNLIQGREIRVSNGEFQMVTYDLKKPEKLSLNSNSCLLKDYPPKEYFFAQDLKIIECKIIGLTYGAEEVTLGISYYDLEYSKKSLYSRFSYKIKDEYSRIHSSVQSWLHDVNTKDIVLSECYVGKETFNDEANKLAKRIDKNLSDLRNTAYINLLKNKDENIFNALEQLEYASQLLRVVSLLVGFNQKSIEKLNLQTKDTVINSIQTMVNDSENLTTKLIVKTLSEKDISDLFLQTPISFVGRQLKYIQHVFDLCYLQQGTFSLEHYKYSSLEYEQLQSFQNMLKKFSGMKNGTRFFKTNNSIQIQLIDEGDEDMVRVFREKLTRHLYNIMVLFKFNIQIDWETARKLYDISKLIYPLKENYQTNSFEAQLFYNTLKYLDIKEVEEKNFIQNTRFFFKSNVLKIENKKEENNHENILKEKSKKVSQKFKELVKQVVGQKYVFNLEREDCCKLNIHCTSHNSDKPVKKNAMLNSLVKMLIQEIDVLTKENFEQSENTLSIIADCEELDLIVRLLQCASDNKIENIESLFFGLDEDLDEKEKTTSSCCIS